MAPPTRPAARLRRPARPHAAPPLGDRSDLLPYPEKSYGKAPIVAVMSRAHPILARIGGDVGRVKV